MAGSNLASSLDATLSALADPHRRRVIDALREAPRRAGELAEIVGLSPPAMSRHLRALRQCDQIGRASCRERV